MEALGLLADRLGPNEPRVDLIIVSCPDDAPACAAIYAAPDFLTAA
jgi:hypothetical protein